MLYLGITILFVIIATILKLTWSFKKQDFLEAEADRCINNLCKADENWNSQGRMYTKGFVFVEKENGKIEMVSQKKLCDIGILS